MLKVSMMWTVCISDLALCSFNRSAWVIYKEMDLPILSSIPAVSAVVGSAVVSVGSAVVSVDSVLVRISSKVPHTSRGASTESVNDKKCRSIFFSSSNICLLNPARSGCD